MTVLPKLSIELTQILSKSQQFFIFFSEADNSILRVRWKCKRTRIAKRKKMEKKTSLEDLHFLVLKHAIKL
jgi:hypothetical protein